MNLEAAQHIIQALGFPRAQRNQRSALCLLALLNLTPNKTWSKAENPLLGITPLMDWVQHYYGKTYAPNTRETIRRKTLHQFCDAGLILYNPDQPDRAINSPKTVYQIEPAALTLLQTFHTAAWQNNLACYLKNRPTLIARYAQERQHNLIPIQISSDQTINLSPGEHSELIRATLKHFAPRFAPDSQLIYVGDTGNKWRYSETALLTNLGVTLNTQGKMPDIILHYTAKNWLLLIECVTSHGPVDNKRHNELAECFADSRAGLVYVTAFPHRTFMARYLAHIAWETEVWVADAPSHLIHFNGERFLGPHTQQP